MGNGEMGRRYIAFHSANCRCFVTAVMRKSMSIHALTERSSLPDSWHQMGMQWHCITVCKLALCISSSLWQLVSLFVESVSYFVPTSYKESF